MLIPVNFDVRTWVDGLGQTFWPARCLVCDNPCAGHLSGRDLCAQCELRLPWNTVACRLCAIPLPLPAPACGHCLRHRPLLATTTAAFTYVAPIDQLLRRLKFHQALQITRLLADVMSEAFASQDRPAALVPIPLHRQRLRERGYDQTLELAQPLAKAMQLPLRPDLLWRNKLTAPQSDLDSTQRRRNLRDAFQVRPDVALPAHVVLFDDVMTTGATLRAAASALHRAGVQRVDAWVCARAP